jgi:hypothetical protein
MPRLQTSVIHTIDTVLVPDLPDNRARPPPPGQARTPADIAGTPRAMDTQPSPAETKSVSVAVAVGATVGCLVLLAVAAAALIYMRKQRALQQHADVNNGPKLWGQPGAAGAVPYQGSSVQCCLRRLQHSSPALQAPSAPSCLRSLYLCIKAT